MLVKITRGYFGHNVNGHVKTVCAGETVDVPAKIAERLIKSGAGECVDTVVCAFAEEEEPLYDENSTVVELRKVAAEVGIKFKSGTSKADMISALDKYYGVTE